MAVQSFATEIKSINIYKFGALKAGLLSTPDKNNSLNIMPQVQEATIFESIFEPVIRCELAVYDYIGLFTNFPLTGEEIVIVEYKNVGDDVLRKWHFAIDSITDITADATNRAVAFMINCVSVEALANTLGTVQKSYKGSGTSIAKQIFEENITKRVKDFLPGYAPPNIISEENDTQSYTIVVPNMHPIAAIDMVNELIVSQIPSRYTYLFYQNVEGFNFRTIQGLTQAANKRKFAFDNSYKFFSDISSEKESQMKNDVKIVSNLTFNKRHSSLQKVATGYFNNNLFEINIAQKAVHSTRVMTDEITTIYPNLLNTQAYKDWTYSFIDGDEKSNRTKYALTTRKEQDNDYPVSRARDRWGKDLISKIALSQVDLSVVIPGTNRFVAGDMFHLEIPEFHGFENMNNDDLVSGFYLITEIKQIIRIGGFQSTVLRLNKDSYKTNVDRDSKYK